MRVLNAVENEDKDVGIGFGELIQSVFGKLGKGGTSLVMLVLTRYVGIAMTGWAGAIVSG